MRRGKDKQYFPVRFRLGGGGWMDENVAMRLLTLHIQEPIPGRVLPLMARDHGPDEAARRYRAIVVTMLRQLRGLAATRLRILPDPEDAAEAIRFWLLPRLAGSWQVAGTVFHADGWEIDFGDDSATILVEASGEVLCPFLGARWVHTAMLGLERGTHRVRGPASNGGDYFRARPAGDVGLLEDLEERLLPELPVIHNDNHWNEALDSLLGPTLKRAWEEEGGGK